MKESNPRNESICQHVEVAADNTQLESASMASISSFHEKMHQNQPSTTYQDKVVNDYKQKLHLVKDSKVASKPAGPELRHFKVFGPEIDELPHHQEVGPETDELQHQKEVSTSQRNFEELVGKTTRSRFLDTASQNQARSNVDSDKNVKRVRGANLKSSDAHRNTSADPDGITTNSPYNTSAPNLGAVHTYTTQPNTEDVSSRQYHEPAIDVPENGNENNLQEVHVYNAQPSNVDDASREMTVMSLMSTTTGEDTNAAYLEQGIHAELVIESEEFQEDDRAVVVAEEVPAVLEPVKFFGLSRKVFCFVVWFTIINVANLSFGVAFSRRRRRSKSSSTTVSSDDFFLKQPLLQAIKDRGNLRCYAFRFEIIQGSGMSVDLCRAIAAAIFEDPEGAVDYIDFVELPFGEHFDALWNGMIDVSTNYVYQTMKRDVFEPETGLPVSFSTPFFYSGNMFAGKPEFVDCADRLDTLFGVCRDLSVCVSKGTAHVDIVDKLLPGIEKHELIFTNEWYESFVNGTCNIYIVDQVGWTGHYYEPILRNEFGYEGEYVIGTEVHSSDQITMISKGDDQEWADFCNWILKGLITAEAFNITQEIALSPELWSMSTSSMGDKFPSVSSAFGEEYKHMFQNAIAAVGNYGELYERHFESIIPRDDYWINTINSGDSGVLRSVPFGVLTVDDAETLSLNRPLPNPTPNGTLESIVERGILRCGVIGNKTKFALLHETSGNDKEPENTTIGISKRWSGIDIEYCHAISATLFPDRFFNGNIQDEAVIFVDVGTKLEDGYIALDKDEIDIFAGGSMSLSTDVKEAMTGKGFSFTRPYYYYDDDDFDNNKNVDNNNLSRVNWNIGRSLVTRDTDWQWSAFVRWITIAIIYAEDQQITQELAFNMPVVELFGSNFLQMFRDAIFAVGNYGEIFNRTMNEPYNITRKGRNLINTDRTPQFLPVPMV